MNFPAMLVVDDDPDVLRAIDRDLKKRFADRLRIVAANSGAAGLDVLRQLKERGEVTALLLVDQRMPHMSGVEFLESAKQVFPEVKSVLLTAYADTEAAIRAINGARVDYYLLKPWDPPESKLYPVLEDLLDDWFAHYEPPFSGIKIYGHRWSSESFQIRDFLARNQVPYQWVDVELHGGESDVREIVESGHGNWPLVTLTDGPCLESPTPQELAERIGLRTRAERPMYDLVIVGAGPAGLAAAVYGASEGLQTIVVEREAPGGQAGSSSLIENYLGFPRGLTGADLARRARDQAQRFGVEILSQEASDLFVNDGYRGIKLKNDSNVNGRTVLLAMGVSYCRLDVPGEQKLFGKGIYYGAALSEAISCVDEQVLIVGGANSAGQAAVHFSGYANKVIMAVRASSLEKGMSQYLVDRIRKTPNIEVRLQTEVQEILGIESVECAMLRMPQGTETLPVSSVFIFIGAEPHTDWLPADILRDDHGFILTGPDMLAAQEGKSHWKLPRQPLLLETSIPGVFSAGDVRAGTVKRVASSVGQGSISVPLIHQYLREVMA